MANQLVSCPHCGGSGWAKGSSTGRRGRPGRSKAQTFETSVAALGTSMGSNGFRPASNGFSSRPVEQGLSSDLAGVLSPGEERKSFLYHQWSSGDVWVSIELALVSGACLGLSAIGACILTRLPWKSVPIIWLGTTTIVWFVKASDFFRDGKAVVSKQTHTKPLESAPINVEGPSADIVINSGKTQTRAKLWAPKTNHAGLWQYADALVKGTAAPSLEGGDHILGANTYGYTKAEFDGRSDCWRPTAIAGGILEKDPEKSRGYRLTDPGRRALGVIVKRRLGEWG